MATLFNQPDLERVLDERVRSFPDLVTLLQGCEVLAVQPQGEQVLLTAGRTGTGADPGPLQLRARYVVGCDGAGSLVRAAMGSDYDDLGFSADWLVVDLVPKDPAQWTRELVQLCDPARPTTMVAGGPGRRRFEFMLLAGETKAAGLMPVRGGFLAQSTNIGYTRANRFAMLSDTSIEGGLPDILAHAADLILEEKTEWLHDLLEIYIVRKSAYVVVGLDDR